VIVGLAIALVVIAGASVWAIGGGEDGGSLVGTSWVLSDLDGAAVTEPAPTLAFSETEVSGTGGCNTFGGPYAVDGDSITFGPISSTLIACEEPAMSQETAFLAALDTVTYAIDGDTLTLSGDAGTLAFAGA
jgi:heat shock protein HslJ